MSVTPRWATAFAPASVGNVAIGFDILGFSVDALGDRVTVSRTEAQGVTITDVVGVAGQLPTDPAQNTAGRALLAMQEALQPGFGFAMRIDKGIPLGSGLGGSAASAVGAVVAANALLPQPLQQARAAEVRDAGRGGGERLAARRQHRARRSSAAWCSPSGSIIPG